MAKNNSSFASTERMANILNNIMDWLAYEAETHQQWSQDELYGTLHGAFGMTDEEIKAAGFACSPSDGGKTVCVDGGLVQGVACNIPGATCKIYDADTEEYTEEDEAELNVLGNSPGYTWIY